MKRPERRKSRSRSPATRSPSPTRTDPTPLELDRYIPWAFMNLQPEDTVVVKKVYQEEYPSGRNNRFASSSRISRVSTTVSIRQTESYPTLSTVPNITAVTNVENAIPLTIYYNRAGHAVEIAINDCPFPLYRKLIEVISAALPYHNLLNKFTCKGKGLDYSVIDEIAKLLPFSNVTDICLDNTFVPKGSYYILLDQAPALRCISLSKCKINDIVCEKIAKRLECNGSASKNLRILSLSCNLITDKGARALGNSLRTNRHMMHLNLCGNSITSVGAAYVLEPLSEFSLTTNEVKEKIRKMRDFYNKRAEICKSSTSTVTNLSTEEGKSKKDEESLQKNKKDRAYLLKKSSTDSRTNVNITNLDEKVVLEDFSDPSNTVYKNGRWFSIGNLTLCSLNIGYNYLDYTSLSKIINVLLYQKDQDRAPMRTGLLRIVIEGNPLPDSEEYSRIQMYLGILNNEAWSFKQKRKSSASSKTRRDTSVRKASSSVVLGIMA